MEMAVRVRHAVVLMTLRHGWQQYTVRLRLELAFARLTQALFPVRQVAFLPGANFWLLLSENLGYSLGLRFSAIRPKEVTL
jgi:hypothetical protein